MGEVVKTTRTMTLTGTRCTVSEMEELLGWAGSDDETLSFTFHSAHGDPRESDYVTITLTEAS